MSNIFFAHSLEIVLGRRHAFNPSDRYNTTIYKKGFLKSGWNFTSRNPQIWPLKVCFLPIFQWFTVVLKGFSNFDKYYCSLTEKKILHWYRFRWQRTWRECTRGYWISSIPRYLILHQHFLCKQRPAVRFVSIVT